jgi:hypothetical protein
LISLDEKLVQVCNDLSEVGDASRASRTEGTLSDSSYDFYEECIGFEREVQDAKELIAVRDHALGVINTLTNFTDRTNPENIIFHGLSIPFWHARLLAIQSYCSTAWAVYDSLSKIAGKLICVDSKAKQRKKPFKLQEDFLDTAEGYLSSRMHTHLKESYGWPIGFSYAIRNWLLHDANSKDGVNLFESRNITITPYRISDEAWVKLEKQCRKDYHVQETQTRYPDPWPWHREELNELLKILHAEVDEAIGILICWAAESVKSQAKLLVSRDLQ